MASDNNEQQEQDTHMTSMTSMTVTRRTTAALLVAVTALAAACSDDSTDSASLTPAGCDAFAAIGASMFGDPSGVPDQVDILVAETSDDLEDAAEVYGAAMVAAMNGDESAMDSAEFASAAEDVGTAATQSCDTVANLDVTGVDFAFDGLPEQVDAGRIGIEFTNGTTTDEEHEMLVLQRIGDSDETVEELLELPEEELFGKVAPMAVTYADAAGDTHHALVDLEAGDYIAICMIPTAGEGPPHALNGMVTEFTVG